MLAFGSLGFYLLLATFSLAMLLFVELEKWGWATIILATVFITLPILGGFNLLTFTLAEPGKVLLAVAGYLVFGAVWSIVKWWFFVQDKAEVYKSHRAVFMESLHLHPTATMPEDQKDNFNRFMNSFYGERPARRPELREHKGTIMSWMVYWPWSLSWTLVSNPVKKVFTWIYRSLQDVYENISKNAWKHVHHDLPEGRLE